MAGVAPWEECSYSQLGKPLTGILKYFHFDILEYFQIQERVSWSEQDTGSKKVRSLEIF